MLGEGLIKVSLLFLKMEFGFCRIKKSSYPNGNINNETRQLRTSAFEFTLEKTIEKTDRHFDVCKKVPDTYARLFRYHGIVSSVDGFNKIMISLIVKGKDGPVIWLKRI